MSRSSSTSHRCCVPMVLCQMVVTFGMFVTHPATAEDGLSQRALNVLERRCLSCHNSIDQQGDLAFTTSESVLESGLVESGDAAASHLINVVTAQGDDAPQMPKDSDPLPESEIRLLKQWIDSGADWPEGYQLASPANDDFDWWSFRPLVQPAIPEFAGDSESASWIQNPIDAFIAKQHRERGLVHAPQADRRTLIRRLYYDLTGLPPTPEEVRRFVESENPNAWSELIDRLLASERYGERWARHWLDVVKYADTCGYDKDKLRPNAWPYRDYVIDSFNADKPYARFVQEQVAGDILFPGTADGIRALGFVAAGPWDFIGHAEVSEEKIDGKVARNLDRDDMVANTLNTFCSVTIQCSRCHNHKFDPFTQEHYYSLQSIFAAVDKADRVFDASPEIETQRNDLKDQVATAKSALREHEESIRPAGGERLLAAVRRVSELQSGLQEESRPEAHGYHSQITSRRDDAKWVQIDLGRSVQLSEIRLHACSDDFAGIGPGFGFPVRFRIEVSAEPFAAETSSVLLSRESLDVTNPGLAPLSVPIDDSPIRFIRITAIQLAERSNDYILALAELEAIDTSGVNVALNAKVAAKDSIEAPVRWQKTNLTDGLFPTSNRPEQAQKLAAAQAELDSLLAEIQTPDWIQRRDELNERIGILGKQLTELPEGQLVYAAATEFKPNANFKPTGGKPRTVRVLHRGNVTQPLQEVQPGVVPLSKSANWRLDLPDDHSEADRRAALARWLTSQDHPLTWRSVVNRIWQYHFGEPLVASPNDFGRMGQQPSHPQLLDWLAVEFRDGRQSFKDMHRLILMSAAWQQASIHDQENAAIDSNNQYLWRHSRRRLSAEELRDSVLAVSGQLNLSMGGPGYYLFALEKTDHSPHYEYHKFDPSDAATHRRSIYRFVVRSQPDPFMMTLDCADSSQSTPRRTETFTALQALSLMNNDFTLVMSRAFGEHLSATAADESSTVSTAFSLCTGRQPTDAEHSRLVGYMQTHGLPALCRLLFNLNEFIFVD